MAFFKLISSMLACKGAVERVGAQSVAPQMLHWVSREGGGGGEGKFYWFWQNGKHDGC